MALGRGPGHSRYRPCRPLTAPPRALWTAAIGPRKGNSVLEEPFVHWTEHGIVCAGPDGLAVVLDAATGAKRYEWPEPWTEVQALGPLVYGLADKKLTTRSLLTGADRSTTTFPAKPLLALAEPDWLVASFNGHLSGRRLNLENGAPSEKEAWINQCQLLAVAGGTVWSSHFFDIPNFEGEVVYAWSLETGEELWRGGALASCAGWSGHSRFHLALSDGKRLASTLLPEVVERDWVQLDVLELGSDEPILRIPDESVEALAPGFLVYGGVHLRCLPWSGGKAASIGPPADRDVLVVAGDVVFFAGSDLAREGKPPPTLHAARADGTVLWSVACEALGLGRVKAIEAADERLYVLDEAGKVACLGG